VIQNYNIAVLRDLGNLYSYEYHGSIDVGQLVVVNFGNKETIGIVVNCDPPNFKGKIKRIDSVLPYKISETYIKFARFVSDYNLNNIGSVFKLMIPFSIDLILAAEKNIKSFHVVGTEQTKLNEEQTKALHDILKFKDKFKTILLHGITGSGKTEVFLEFAKSIDKQVLILIPEIALSRELTKKVSEKLGIEAFIWHNSISKAKKIAIWKKAINGDRIAVVGARSALFIPFSNLGAIVVDEEHDTSFKQNETTIYNARDMAVYLGSCSNIPIILSSATPSVESYNNARVGKYEYVKLCSRYFENAKLPSVIIDDLKREKLSGSLSSVSISKIKECLTHKKQALIFVNRRGHTPKVLCRSCGWKVSCPGCSSWLCYHHNTNEFMCHYCGFKTVAKHECAECGEKALIGIGTGIEKVQEECQTLFPEARLLTLSSDTVDTPNKIEKAIETIKRNEVDIILGTQIVAKGHNFNNLNLVIVTCVDAMLYGEDFRAIEKAFQMIYQVSGRAGRTGDTESEVVIQTYNPNDELMVIISNNYTERLYEIEIRNRRLMKVPPFGKMANITVSALSEMEVETFANEFVMRRPRVNEINVLGPIQPTIYKIRSRYRLRILVTSAAQPLQEYISKWLLLQRIPNNIHLSVDIDPYDFM
jgi:primosomal protein N' (replication factor Y)